MAMEEDMVVCDFIEDMRFFLLFFYWQVTCAHPMNFEPTTSLSIPFLERERVGGEVQFELEIIGLIEDIVLNRAKRISFIICGKHQLVVIQVTF